MKNELFYLATPYSKYRYGDLELAFRDAAALAGRLLKQGFKVYSPICHTHPIALYGALDPLDHSIWLPFDEAMMIACPAIIVAHMDGWQESSGIAHEIKFFETARKAIYDLDVATLELTLRVPPKPERTRHDLTPETVKQLDKTARDQWLNPEMG